MKAHLPVLTGLFCCLALAAGPVLADTSDASTEQTGDTAPEVSLWVKQAPLSLVVRQLAELSGREAVIDGTLDAPVSARFSGDVQQALSDLSTNYPVLFDIDEGTVNATAGEAASSVSVAVVSDELSDDFRNSLFEALAPGNDVEIRSDAIRISGHPDFVKRVSGLVARTWADNGARVPVEPDGEIAIGAALAGIASDANSADEAAAEVVIDSGSDEMLADMADEEKPPADQAVLSKPIRWVTDIPGYDTF